MRGLAEVLDVDIASLTWLPNENLIADRAYVFYAGSRTLHSFESWRDVLAPRVLRERREPPNRAGGERPLIVLCYNGTNHYEVALPGEWDRS